MQRCPSSAIALSRDDEGFLYPMADATICNDCGLCERVCPYINQDEPRRPLEVYAAINPVENIRRASSSGGVFTVIAEKVITDGGVVFGAMFNDQWAVEHGCIDCIEDLHKLRGSKYVQSRIGTAFQQVEVLLKLGRTVLFSGTSCQVAGLKKYLRKDYDKLLTVDVVCHGVPSPQLWKDYLASLETVAPIQGVNMKDKSEGWMSYKITITGEKDTLSERALVNKYMMAFSQNLSLRPSCYQCPSKSGKSGSDITLGDYWGVEKLVSKMYDNKGTSFVCANTPKGLSMLVELPLNMEKADYNVSIPYNACIVKSTAEPPLRAAFWAQYKRNQVKALDALNPNRANIIRRAMRWIERRIK